MKKNQTERSASIFGEESEQVLEPVVETKSEEMPTEDRKRLNLIGITIGISILIVALVLVVGVISGIQSQKQEAAQAPRESTPTFYGVLEEADIQADTITSVLTEAYYTAENGMWVTVEFYNDTDSDQHVSKATITLYNEAGGEIAKAATAGIDGDYLVGTGESNDLKVYFKPEFVSITDDPLSTIRCEITVEHEARN